MFFDTSKGQDMISGDMISGILELQRILNKCEHKEELTAEEIQRGKDLVDILGLSDDHCAGCSFIFAIANFGYTDAEKKRFPKAIEGIGLCKECCIEVIEYTPYYKRVKII